MKGEFNDVFVIFFPNFLSKSICCGYLLEYPRQESRQFK